MTGTALVAAARALEGTRFRLGGRDPEHGLDCIGLLQAALARIGRPVVLPQGYPLRLARPDAWLPDPASLGFAAVCGPCQPGDAVLIRPSAGQLHLVIAGPAGEWIHAHAGLRRVVVCRVRPAGPVLGHWRLLPAD